jgi:hypothetical protein
LSGAGWASENFWGERLVDDGDYEMNLLKMQGL